MAADQLSKLGLEVLLYSRSETQYDPLERVNSVAFHEVGLQSIFHGIMKSLTELIPLQVVCHSVVNLHPQTLSDCCPEF